MVVFVFVVVVVDRFPPLFFFRHGNSSSSSNSSSAMFATNDGPRGGTAPAGDVGCFVELENKYSGVPGKYYYETDELPNPWRTQPKKN